MIDSKDISVVVQGAIIKRETLKCLQSIREFLPKSEIILSTWTGSDLKELEGLFDILVLNEDPGAVYYENTKLYHNINRQIVSTKNGIKSATKNYILKLRSDLILNGMNFLEHFEDYPLRNEKYKLFSHKIVVPATFSRFKYKHSSIPTPFQISDWWYFGLSQDIKMVFDAIELVQEPQYSKYFEDQEAFSYLGKKYPARYTPEQYFCLSVFNKKFPDIKMKDMMDYNDDICEKSFFAVINNFIVLEFEDHNIYTNKHDISKDEKLLGEGYCTLFNKVNYEYYYKNLFDKNFIVNEIEYNKINLFWYLKYLKLYKSLYQLKTFKFVKKLEMLFIAIPINTIVFLFYFLFFYKKKVDSNL